MRIGLIGSGQMGDRVEEVAQERGDTILLLPLVIGTTG